MAGMLIAVNGDRALLDTLRTALAAAGHMVATTQDGAEAWNLLATGTFDGAVLDTTLPSIDGITLLDRIRATPNTAGMPVALLATDEHERISLLAHRDDAVRAVLAKPVTAEDLADALRLHFGVSIPAGLVSGMREVRPKALFRPARA